MSEPLCICESCCAERGDGIPRGPCTKVRNLSCVCGPYESCDTCHPPRCTNRSDEGEECAEQLCAHMLCGQCDVCDICHFDPKCSGCGVIYPNACQCPKGTDDDIAF